MFSTAVRSGRKHQSFLKQEEIMQNSPFLPLPCPLLQLLAENSTVLYSYIQITWMITKIFPKQVA